MRSSSLSRREEYSLNSLETSFKVSIALIKLLSTFSNELSMSEALDKFIFICIKASIIAPSSPEIDQ